jgi:hypothetical protein
MALDTPAQIKQFLEAKSNKTEGGQYGTYSLIDKVGNTYTLEKGVLSVIKPDYYHSWDYVSSQQKLLTENLGNDPLIDEVNSVWQMLSDVYGEMCIREDIIPKRPRGKPMTPIEVLVSQWEFSVYPPPELMNAIVAAFRHYMALGGLVSLEEVFFGKPITGAGNYAARQDNWAVKMLDFRIGGDEINNTKVTKIKRADELVIEYDLDYDAESLLRRWRRYKKNGSDK